MPSLGSPEELRLTRKKWEIIDAHREFGNGERVPMSSSRGRISNNIYKITPHFIAITTSGEPVFNRRRNWLINHDYEFSSYRGISKCMRSFFFEMFQWLQRHGLHLCSTSVDNRFPLVPSALYFLTLNQFFNIT